MNGQQYSRGGAAQFAYHDAEAVLALSPSSGLVTGATVVRVLGQGFQPFVESVCRFGDGNARFSASLRIRHHRCSETASASSNCS